MSYRIELEYLVKVLKKMHIGVHLIPHGSAPDRGFDMDLRRTLGIAADYEQTFRCPGTWAEEKTIYKLSDEYMCNYIFLLLPGNDGALLIGPYLSFEPEREQLLEIAENLTLPAVNFPRLEAIYASIPLMRDKTPLLSMVNVLGETLWGKGSAFRIIDTEHEFSPGTAAHEQPGIVDPGDFMAKLKAAETRYSYENELLATVEQGLSSRAEMMMANLSMKMMDRRSPDPVRNVKIYCFICSTLLRKAAEKGGVHPVHIDTESTAFARRIEALGTVEDGIELMREMVRGYCRLVRNLSSGKYSPFVSRTATYIDSNIAGDLSLSALAALQNVNASYLSTIFRRETGKTVTAYVTEKRMDTAARLLRTTNLQIQTVAQHCGMSDVNYFSKLFKKQYGVTPKQFRDENRPYLR